MRRITCMLGSLLLLALAGGVWAQAVPPEVEAEIAHLKQVAPTFAPARLTAKTGEVVIPRSASITVEDLRDRAFDPAAIPELTTPVTYPPEQLDGYAPGKAPYVAASLKPFALSRFKTVLNADGPNNWGMTDYLATHGFNLIVPVKYTPATRAQYPPATRWLTSRYAYNWDAWFKKQNAESGRFDLLVGQDLPALLKDTFKQDPQYHALLINGRFAPLTPDKLREQPWFPKEAAEQRPFIERYYQGVALSVTAQVAAARASGWAEVGIAGYVPVTQEAAGGKLNPATDVAWNNYGKAIAASVDFLFHQQYFHYYGITNVSMAALLHVDGVQRYLDTLEEGKRPYLLVGTTLNSGGGGGGWRWWRAMPLPAEELRAQTVFNAFSGARGLGIWQWFNTANIHAHTPIAQDADLMLQTPLTATPIGPQPNMPATTFNPYDVLHVTGVEGEQVTVQKITPGVDNNGVNTFSPVYRLPQAELDAHLRPISHAVSGVVEGLALLKPLEYLITHGTRAVDVPLRFQHQYQTPYNRRITVGNYHVIATYDPKAWGRTARRELRLRNFNGHRGLTLVLPVDAQVRLYVLREE